MNSGKARRLKRIFGEDGKTVIIPMDHGVTLGPVKGLVNMQSIVDALAHGGTDAIVIHKGVAKNIDTRRLGLIIHLMASTVMAPDPNWKVPSCSVEEAVKLGADGVSVHINMGAPREAEMLTDLGVISESCEDYSIPLLAMMYPRGPKITDSNDVEVVKHAARLGAELGADVIKTNYTGTPESFKYVVESCTVPVVIAGGPKQNNPSGVLKMVYDSIQAGGSGISLGRNVFQHPKPSAMVKALRAIVHDGALVEESLKILEEG